MEDFELQVGWSCCFLRRGRRWREEQVSGGRSRAQRLSLDGYSETIRLLDGDTDLLVGYKTLTQEEKTECRRYGISVVFKTTRRNGICKGMSREVKQDWALGSGSVWRRDQQRSLRRSGQNGGRPSGRLWLPWSQVSKNTETVWGQEPRFGCLKVEMPGILKYPY